MFMWIPLHAASVLAAGLLQSNYRLQAMLVAARNFVTWFVSPYLATNEVGMTMGILQSLKRFTMA